MLLDCEDSKNEKIIFYFCSMKKSFFATLAQLNKWILPSLTKKKVDLANAKKWQMALFGYKLWVTKNALG